MTFKAQPNCPCEMCRAVREPKTGADVLKASGYGKALLPPAAEMARAMGYDKPGMKFDGGKAPIDSLFLRYFPRAIEAVAMVSEYGARKYAPMNWVKVDNGIERYTDGLGRHKLKEHTEGLYDNGDSGLAHAAQVAWNALARLELMLKEGVVETRRGNDLKDGKPVLGTAKKI